MEITDLFKDKVVAELLVLRENFGGSDAAFARSMDINPSVFNRLKNGEREKLLPNTTWLRLGREMGIITNTRKWNAVETDVKSCFANSFLKVEFSLIIAVLVRHSLQDTSLKRLKTAFTWIVHNARKRMNLPKH